MWVCSSCAIAQQINESDLEVSAVMKGMPGYVKAVTESDRNLSF
ncbi:MAG: DsrE family protein [Nitrospirota bacterium]